MKEEIILNHFLRRKWRLAKGHRSVAITPDLANVSFVNLSTIHFFTQRKIKHRKEISHFSY